MQNDESIFAGAVGQATPEARIAFLDAACAGDPKLRARIEGLLWAHAHPDSFLNPADDPSGGTQDSAPYDATIAAPPDTASAGTTIGPYKLLQQIGEGGMGTVYMAKQTAPVQRKVALKLIKAGMDSRHVIARFEAERQALALMDHPHIAKVLDAGTTDSGLPYFVMELVRGVPITKYCDEHHLTPRQRLELFIPICQAVQHAHQKGIIHRDLKPSNVLVVLYDGQPVSKVIDFGVAKATGQKLTERTMYTEFGAIVGTLEYMSPEQAEPNQLDIDTRSDIYSLGVLLYELLTGTTPFEKKWLKDAALLEVLRIIREDEPQKPSTRLSTTDELPSISANRGLEPKKLSDQVRGELDWIVMKALDKDRNRRYETANGLALDVQRYLADEAVQACPPSAGYRLRKFARRNKAGLAVAGLVLFFVVLLGTVIGWGVRDREARELQVAHDREARELQVAHDREAREQEVAHDREARQKAAEQGANLALDEAARWQEQRKWPEALSAAKRADGLLAGGGSEAIRERLRDLRRDIDMVLRLEDARVQGVERLKDGIAFDFAAMDVAFGRAFFEDGIDVETLPAARAAELIRARSIHLELSGALDQWASYTRSNELRNKLIAVAREVDSDEWRSRVRDALWAEQRSQQRLAELAASDQVRSLPPSSLSILGSVLSQAGLADDAVALLRDAQQRHPDDFWINNELARTLGGRQPPPWDEIVRCYSMALAVRPGSTGTLNNVGNTLLNKGRPDEAIPYFQRAVEIDPLDDNAQYALAIALDRVGRVEEALPRFRRAVELDPNNAMKLSNLGWALQTENPEEAIKWYQQAIAVNPKYARAYINLGVVHRASGQIGQAVANLRKAVEVDPQSVSTLGAFAEALVDALGLKPDDPDTQFELGNTYARLGRWKEATAAFDRGFDLRPPGVQFGDVARLFQAALLYAIAGDVEGYRRTCRELVHRFGDSKDGPIVGQAAVGCLLLPGALSAADFNILQELVTWLLGRTETDRWYYHWSVRTKGLADYRAGRYADAVKWLEQFGPDANGDHHDVLVFATLSMAQRRLGRAEDAEDALAKARAILAKLPDPAQGRPLDGKWHDRLMAPLLFREAEDDVLMQTLAIRKAKFGADHPDTLNAMTELASRYDKTGRDAEAVKLYEELLALRKARLGADHTDTLNTMADLADRYGRVGRHADAVKSYEELLVLRKARSGADHPDTLSTMASLADSYFALGREAQAIELYAEAVKGEKARPAADDNRRVATLRALAACYDKLGRYSDSLTLYEEVLALRKARLGADHPDTAWCLRSEAQTLVKLDRGTQAVPLIDEFVERLSGKVGRQSIAEMLWLRMRHFEKTSAAAACRVSAEMWEKQRHTTRRLDFDFLYNAARCRAITAAVIRAGDQSEMAARDSAAEADRAMSWLRQAAVTRINDLQTMKQDPDLASLRGREDFTKLVALRESEFAAREFELGGAQAQLGRWKEAAAAFGRGLELYPIDHERWCQGSALFARIGDVEAYRRACHEIIQRFGNTDDAVIAERTSKACLVLPDALSAADFDRAQKLAERAVTGTEKHGYYKFFALAKGLAECRAGRHAEAVKWLERCAPNADGGGFDAMALALLGMAHHDLGDAEQAQAALAKARAVVSKLPDPAKGQPVGDWHYWVYANVLFREAEALMNQDSRR